MTIILVDNDFLILDGSTFRSLSWLLLLALQEFLLFPTNFMVIGNEMYFLRKFVGNGFLTTAVKARFSRYISDEIFGRNEWSFDR
jgi:hypothetical protein